MCSASLNVDKSRHNFVCRTSYPCLKCPPFRIPSDPGAPSHGLYTPVASPAYGDSDSLVSIHSVLQQAEGEVRW